MWKRQKSFWYTVVYLRFPPALLWVLFSVRLRAWLVYLRFMRSLPRRLRLKHTAGFPEQIWVTFCCSSFIYLKKELWDGCGHGGMIYHHCTVSWLWRNSSLDLVRFHHITARFSSSAMIRPPGQQGQQGQQGQLGSAGTRTLDLLIGNPASNRKAFAAHIDIKLIWSSY